jgi:spore maturation protein SpmA
VNGIFLGIFGVAFVTAALLGNMGPATQGLFDGAKTSVELAIGLIGTMAFFLGLMKVAEDAGLMALLARAIRPIMVRLFPDVPADHPAMGAMLLNFSANMLGLDNAATPFGIKAMHELEKLNPHPGTATNAMCLFLAINTSGLALLPSTVVALRVAEDSKDPWGIVTPTLFATAAATIAGIAAAKFMQRLPIFAAPPKTVELSQSVEPRSTDPESPAVAGFHPRAHLGLAAFLIGAIGLLVVPLLTAALLPTDHSWVEALRSFSSSANDAVIPVLVMAIVAFGSLRGVKVYESFVEGAKEGWNVGVSIIPYLVAILGAVGMFRGSGAMDLLGRWIGRLTEPLGMPAEVLPQAIVRPLSGSGARGLMADLMHTHGPDSYIGYLSSVLQGSTETTFYVLAVYFGAAKVFRVRHAPWAGVTADLAGAMGAVFIVSAMYGHLP